MGKYRFFYLPKDGHVDGRFFKKGHTFQSHTEGEIYTDENVPEFCHGLPWIVVDEKDFPKGCRCYNELYVDENTKELKRDPDRMTDLDREMREMDAMSRIDTEAMSDAEYVLHKTQLERKRKQVTKIHNQRLREQKKWKKNHGNKISDFSDRKKGESVEQPSIVRSKFTARRDAATAGFWELKRLKFIASSAGIDNIDVLLRALKLPSNDAESEDDIYDALEALPNSRVGERELQKALKKIGTKVL